MVEAGTGRIIGPYQPSDREVEELIRRAGSHTGGTEFLVHGAQDAVAATFEVHAFVVDAARRWLAGVSPVAVGARGN